MLYDNYEEYENNETQINLAEAKKVRQQK
jgi:hypothetical protein